MTLGEIIKKYRESREISMQEFADKANLSKGYISMLENNKNPSTGLPITPSLPTLKSIANAMGITFDDLFSIIDPDSEISLNNDDFDYARYGLLPVVKRKIPLLGSVHCGAPEYAEEDFLDIVESEIEADYALKAKGDSMIGAGIRENDIVFVKKQPSVFNGELAVVLINNEETAIKRVYKYDTQLVLNADNPSNAPIIFNEGDSGQVEILGRVVAHLHYYKTRREKADVLHSDKNSDDQ